MDASRLVWTRSRPVGNRGETAASQTALRTRDLVLLETMLPKSRFSILQIQSSWSTIAGAANARHCSPSFLRDGVLYVEISHPAYRMALDTPKMRELFLSRIQKEFGEGVCRDLKFVPAGRRGPARTG